MNSDLIRKLLADEADEADAAELRELAEQVTSDEAIRADYIRAIEFEALLSVALEDRLSRAENALKIQDAVDQTDSRDFVAEFRSRIRLRRFGWIAAAAALVLACLFLRFRTTEVIATVVRADRVVYGSGGKTFVQGTGITRGTLLDFEKGLVEVNVGSQGNLLIQGPARVEFSGKSGMILHQGRVVSQLSNSGRGYRIETPEGSAEARGPMMAVAVADRGRTEVHALRGEVLVSLGTQGDWIVEGSKAFRFADRSIFAANGDQFKTDLSQEIAQREIIHWSFDEGSGGVAAARVNGDPTGEELDLRLENIDAGTPPGWVPGAVGAGLAFDGKGSFAESSYPGIEGQHPRTVCFWVKVPRDSKVNEGYSIISWGSHSPEKAWQISIQPMEDEGALGRIRIGTFKGIWVGTTDLRDDRWHHLAVVLKKSQSPEVSTDLTVYVDGVQEQHSYLQSGGVSTSVEPDGHGVWLGRNLARNGPYTSPLGGSFFRGAIDEVYIFNYPLYPGEIQENMVRRSAAR